MFRYFICCSSFLLVLDVCDYKHCIYGLYKVPEEVAAAEKPPGISSHG